MPLGHSPGDLAIDYCRAVIQLCLTLCDPTDCSTPSFPAFHCLLEFEQTYVHWVSDSIQPSHPLLSPCLPAFNLSQHQSLFQWVSSSHQVARVTWRNYNSTQLYGIIITTLEINNRGIVCLKVGCLYVLFNICSRQGNNNPSTQQIATPPQIPQFFKYVTLHGRTMVGWHHQLNGHESE